MRAPTSIRMSNEILLETHLVPERSSFRQVESRETLMIVDDMPENLLAMGDLFRSTGYRVKVATSGSAALRLACQPPIPSLILLDVMMPTMDGFEVFQGLRKLPEARDIPVIFVTAKDELGIEESAFAIGVVDLIKKPIRPGVVLARVRNQLVIERARRWLREQNQRLECEIRERMLENEVIQDVCIRALAHLAETRDDETGNHVRRTQNYVRLLARCLSGTPRFAETLTESVVQNLVRSAPLHDIGKVGIPDQILLKPGPLAPAEREIMKTHTILGCEAISTAERDTDSSLEFLSHIKEIVRWHHECWDGSGYPDGLAGEAIPVSARIMAIADVFDALIAKRAYKEAMPFAQVKETISGGRGTQFDPYIVDAFLFHWEEFKSIALEGNPC